jgi:copper transport protein
VKAGAVAVRALLLGALFTVLAMLGAPGVAQAHGDLVRSDPPAGGMVAIGRTELSLWFAEAIDIRASRFLLHTVDGQTVEVSVSTSDDGSHGFLALTSSPLARGIYVLDWQTLSAEDGHSSQGSLLFGAGTRPDVVPSTASGRPGLTVVLMGWLHLSALLLALGAVAVTGRVLTRGAPAAPGLRRRGVAVGAAACVIGLVPTILTPFLRTPRAAEPLTSWADATLTTVLDTRWGQLWTVEALGLLVAGAALVVLLRRPHARWARPIAGLALAGAALADASAGHAANLTHGATLAAAVTGVHVLAAGVWVGGLAVLAVCVLPGLRHAPEPRRTVLFRSLRAFSPMAAVSAAALLGSGLYLAGRQVPDLDALRTTWYGTAALGKTAAVLLTLCVAGFTTLAVNPRIAAVVGRWAGRPVGWVPPRHRIVELVGTELALLTVAVALAAVMTSTPTARERALTDDVAAPRTATVDGIFVTFEAVPAGAGEDRVIVRTRAITRPQPGPMAGVHLLLVGPDQRTTTLDLREIEPGRFEAATRATEPGTWQVWIAVKRPPAADAIAQVSWEVAPTGLQEATTFERIATAAGWLLMAVAAAGAVRLLLGGRRKRPAPGSAGSDPAEPIPAASSRTDERHVVGAGPRS